MAVREGRLEASQSRIHIIDDDPSVLQAADRLLTAAGFSVRGFPSTRAFLAQQRDEPPALVVLNLPAPVSSRLQVLRELRASGFRMPTIVMSDDANLHSRDECLAMGAAGYLRKPLDDRLLLNAISAALARPAMTR